MTEPALVPAPVHGLRTWVPVGPSGAERLAGPQQREPWPDGGAWLEAACARDPRHPAPDPGCACGVHAWHPRPDAARTVLAGRWEIPGVVELRGRVELHEDGLRAERARPAALLAAPGRNRARIARLAAAHRVPVVDVTGPGDVLAWCEERRLGLSEATVARLLGTDPGARRRRRRRAARTAALRVLAALVLGAALVAAGEALTDEQPSGREVFGRGGTQRTP